MSSTIVAVPAEEISNYLQTQYNKPLLRFMTCGSVDDGKSTLIGRLLYDAHAIHEDRFVALEKDSRRYGAAGDDVDFALLVDGLAAEREQGITIDVAYHFFSSGKRRFIVADTPGHEEYTRNMATGASTADLAIVLVDCTKGILRQTRRHSYIASLLGIRHIVLAANKIDLVGYDQAVFERIAMEYLAVAGDLGFQTIQPIPMVARYGDNVAKATHKMAWYKGPCLLEHLETVPIQTSGAQRSFRFPVQYVSRPDSNFRGFAGQVAAGSIAIGDDVIIAKSGRLTQIRGIISDVPVNAASVGQSVTLVLEDESEVSRGDMLVSPGDRPDVADQFQAHLIWFDSDPMVPGRSYILRTETESIGAAVTALKYEVDINTFAHLAAKVLKMNGVGVCNFSTQLPIVFDSYESNRTTGNFILIDRSNNRTVGAGMINFALRRASNVQWQALEVNRNERAGLKNQKASVIWFTGLSASGKSTIANRLEKLFHSRDRHTYLLDGDNVRHGLNKDLGFTNEDRVENVRRVAEVAKLMADAGLIVLVALISPFRSERQLARDLMGPGEFIEVFVDTPIDECVQRDPKGLYKKAMNGVLANFSGITSSYEPPEMPEIHLKTVGADPDELAVQVFDFVESISRNEPAG